VCCWQVFSLNVCILQLSMSYWFYTSIIRTSVLLTSFLTECVHLTVINVLLILYQHYKDQCVVDKFSHWMCASYSYQCVTDFIPALKGPVCCWQVFSLNVCILQLHYVSMCYWFYTSIIRTSVLLTSFLTERVHLTVINVLLILYQHCVVPENIHTPPTDGQWKFLGGGGAKR